MAASDQGRQADGRRAGSGLRSGSDGQTRTSTPSPFRPVSGPVAASEWALVGRHRQRQGSWVHNTNWPVG